MRITHQMTTNNAIRNMQNSRERLDQIQNRASGQALQVASDHPSAARQVINLRSTLQTLRGYQETARQAQEWLSAGEVFLQDLEDIGSKAVQTVTRGLNDTLSAADRAEILAPEINRLLEQAVAAGNAQNNLGQYLFSGFQVNTPPFTQTDPVTINYAGDDGQIMQRIGPRENLPVNLDGSAVLLPFFQTLIDTRAALENNNLPALETLLSELQGRLTDVSNAHAENGLRYRQAQLADNRLDGSILESQSMLSQREDVDMVEAISLLRNQETTYQAVLEVSQRAISALNLFEYLR